MRDEPDAGPNEWATRLAAIKDELRSEQVESVGDVLRLGERVLTAAGIDVGAQFDVDTGPQTERGENAETHRTVLRTQGAYYVVSGLWAVVDRRGFEAVTGPKADYWLVRTVGFLAATIGLSLWAGTRRGRPSSETIVLGVAAGVSFTAVDLFYVARRRISPVYLGDAAVHGLLAGLALVGQRRRRAC